MADGSVKIGVELDAQKLESQLAAQAEVVDKLGQSLTKTNAALDKTEGTYKQLGSTLDATKAKIDQQASAWETAMKHAGDAGKHQVAVGQALSVAVTAPLVGVATAAAKAAIDFESAFAGVEKTVDGTKEQMADLRQGIIDMSNEMPQTSTNLAAIAEAAGQLGVSTDGILGFTRVIADLREATNLGEDAAATFARFANVTKMSESEFSNLGSAVVELGNNFATTESDIMAMAMRLAGAGTQIGLNQAQILGFATALSSVGIEAEAGGSAFSKVFTSMQLAVETGKDGLKDFAKVSGMTGKEFQQLFKRDAAGAIQAFISGLSKMDAEGTSAIKVLDDMGIKEVRLRDALLRATTVQGMFADATETANSAWVQNTALATEAEKRYATFESRLQIVKNQAMSVAQGLGETFVMPALEVALEQVQGLISGFQGLDEATQGTIVNFAAVAAAVGPAFIGLGKANEGIAAVSTGLKGLSAIMSAAGGGFTGLTAAFSSLIGPAGYLALAAAGIYGLGKAIEWIESKAPTVENAVNKMFASLDPDESKRRQEQFRTYIDAAVDIRATTTITEVGDTVETKVSAYFAPIIETLEAGKTVTPKIAATVTLSSVTLVEGLKATIEANAQAEIDKLDAQLKIGAIDTTTYTDSVATIKADAEAAKTALTELASTTTTSINGMVGNANTTVADAQAVMSGFSQGITDVISLLNSAPSMITAASLYSTIASHLTDGMKDNPTKLKDEISGVIDEQMAEVTAYINGKLDELDINDPNYEAAKQNILAEGQSMSDQLTNLQTALNTFVEQMSGKSKAEVEARLADLQALVAELAVVNAEIDATIGKSREAQREQQANRVRRIEGGYETNRAVIEQTLAVVFSNYELDLQSLEAQKNAALAELERQNAAGELTDAAYKEKASELETAYEKYVQQVKDSYTLQLSKLLAGITKGNEDVGPKIEEAASKLELADSIRNAHQKLISGELKASDISDDMMQAIADTFGIDRSLLERNIEEGLGDPSGYSWTAVSDWLTGSAEKLELDAGSALEGLDFGDLGMILADMTELGLTDGLKGYDPKDSDSVIMALTGRLAKYLEDPGYMMEPIPFEAAIDTILHPEKDGAETNEEAREIVQAQVQGSGGAPVEVTVPVELHGDVKEPTGGESIAEEVSDAVKQQTEDAPAVEPEVSIEPEVTVEEPDTGESAADVAKESVEEQVEDIEAVPVAIKLAATVTMGETATSSATTAGVALANAVAAGALSGIGTASAAMANVAKAAVAAVSPYQAQFKAAGSMMSVGLAQGIRAGKSGVISAAIEVAKAAISAAKTALDEHSPSKEGVEIGLFFAKGIAEGIAAGEAIAAAATKNLADVILAASSSNADVLRNRRMTEIQTEIAEMSRILDEYQAMLDDKQKQKEIKDAQAAIKNAKNKKERLKAQEAYNDLMRKYEMERLKDQQEFLEAELAAYEANVQTLVDAYDFLGDRVIEALTTRYEQERDLQLERIDAEYEAATKAADALYELRKSASDQYLKQLEAERDAEVAALQARIDELNAESKAERDAAREAADAAKLAELRANVEQSKNAKFLAEAEAALQAELEKQAQEARERERQAEIESLRQQITDAKDNYTEQKELEQIRMEEVEAAYKAQTEMIKANYDQQKSYYEKFYKELLSAENLNAQARYYLLQESNDEMIALLEEYNPEWYNAGRSFGELFVEALGVEMENVNALIEQAASFAQNRLDWIRAQISEMNSVGSSSGSDNILGSASQSALDQLLSSGAGAATPKTVMLTQEFSFEFNQPIQSPSEVAAAVRAAGQEAAYAIP